MTLTTGNSDGGAVGVDFPLKAACIVVVVPKKLSLISSSIDNKVSAIR